MIGEVFQSNRDGAVTVVGYENSRKVTVKWHNTGSTSTVQLAALRSGLVRDKSAIARRKADEAAKSKAHAEKLAAAELKRQADKAAAAERKASREAMRSLDKVARESRIAQREAAKAIREARALATCDLSAIQLDESKPRKGVLELDFKDRDGKWVLRFRAGRGPNAAFVQTRLGKLHNNMTQRAKAGGSVQDVHNTTYKGVGLSELFADPQRFCDWVVQQAGWGLGWQLDKDLLAPDNRMYSEDNCIFLPRRLNSAIAISKDARSVRRLAEAYKDTLDPRAYATLAVWEPRK